MGDQPEFDEAEGKPAAGFGKRERGPALCDFVEHDRDNEAREKDRRDKEGVCHARLDRVGWANTQCRIKPRPR